MKNSCVVTKKCASSVGSIARFPPSPPLISPRSAQTAFGMMLGMLSLATVKCSALFVGESLGLLSGLALGIVATFGVSAWTVRRA